MKWRKPALADDVRERLDLESKERILAWTDDGSGRPVIASDTALHVQRVPPVYVRLGWEQIERASYEAGVLTVILGAELGGATLRVPVGEGRDLPVVVRDRITATVIVDRFVALHGEAGVRIVGRRGRSGDITWRTDLDPALAGRGKFDDDVAMALGEIRAEVSNSSAATN